MPQTIERPQTLTFFKWEKPGDKIEIVITEEPTFDKPNQFGSKDSYFRGQTAEDVLKSGEGEDEKYRTQVNMPFDLKAKFKQVAGSVVLGKTRFIITFTGTKPMQGKAPLKLFEVQVEGLKEE